VERGRVQEVCDLFLAEVPGDALARAKELKLV
jgi:hypothetical protein